VEVGVTGKTVLTCSSGDSVETCQAGVEKQNDVQNWVEHEYPEEEVDEPLPISAMTWT
jgi:hypothetical protein